MNTDFLTTIKEKLLKNIINNYKNSIQGIIKRLTGTPNEDLEQEVYLKTWKNIGKYEEKGKFKQWINTITANVCRDYLKSAKFRNENNTIQDDDILNSIASNKGNAENEFERKLRRKRIAEAVYSLKPKLREVIVLYEMEGLSYEEISQRVKCPEGTVKSRIFKARQELYIKLQDLL